MWIVAWWCFDAGGLRTDKQSAAGSWERVLAASVRASEHRASQERTRSQPRPVGCGAQYSMARWARGARMRGGLRLGRQRAFGLIMHSPAFCDTPRSKV